MATTTPALDRDRFIARWNALEVGDRKQLRRLVRIGRPVDDPRLATIAPDYARFQCARPWMRYFWLWFVPGVAFALSVAAGIHPVAVGVVLAFAVQAVLAHRNLRKVART